MQHYVVNVCWFLSMPVTGREMGKVSVSKPTFVLEPGSGNRDQMQKQCSHSGKSAVVAAVTDRVDPTLQSQSA